MTRRSAARLSKNTYPLIIIISNPIFSFLIVRVIISRMDQEKSSYLRSQPPRTIL